MAQRVGYSFKKGYENLKACHQDEVKGMIMGYLGITTRMAWHNRLNGVVQPTIAEYNYITEIINNYGVPKSKIWEEIEL